ncbi:MAG: tyrosine--tRNA ligase [Candidatus Levybacteria bacterium]|nr:tyrosine--tRNA ligase [Candidatus Levybacteria bacterium]
MDKIEEILTRGVEKTYPSKDDLEKVLRSGKKLKIYQGFDPTGIQLHIGHMVGLRKLREWQNLGHEVIFLIGTGTGQAGDPSGKLKTREKFLTEEELKANSVDYVKQAAKIVRFDGENPVKIVFNGDWLNKLKLKDILNIAGHFSLQQLAERDLFQERMKKGEDVNLREFMYPLLQAYDSVVLEVDLEMGGSDQTFNMLTGRRLEKAMIGKDKFVMTTPLLTDSKGIKIGKTEGNVIALTDNPNDLYSKIMGLPDDIVIKGFEYLTDVPISEIKEIEKADNPMLAKKKLAHEIVRQLNTKEAADDAARHFESIVQQKEMPEEIPTFKYSGPSNIGTADLLTQITLAPSKAEAKRLIEQGGVEIDNQRITNPSEQIEIKDKMIIKVGKRKFVRIKI